MADRDILVQELAGLKGKLTREVHDLAKKLHLRKDRKANILRAVDQQVEKSLGMIELLLKGGIAASVLATLDVVAEELEARGEAELEREASLVCEALSLIE
jgi:hypothetical protein